MTIVKQPDLKAPRFREGALNLMTNKMIEKIKAKTSKAKDMSYMDVRKVINAFNGALWNHVIESRDGVDLPEFLGRVFIATCPPPKKVNIDIPKSLKLGVKVTHRNWETDGHLGKVVYTVYDVKHMFKHHDLWGFKAGREFKRSVSSRYPDNWTMYKRAENIRSIEERVKKHKKRDFVLNRSITVPDNYNEFDLD